MNRFMSNLVCGGFSSCSTEIWSWKCWNATKKKWSRHTSVLYKNSFYMQFSPLCIILCILQKQIRDNCIPKGSDFEKPGHASCSLFHILKKIKHSFVSYNPCYDLSESFYRISLRGFIFLIHVVLFYILKLLFFSSWWEPCSIIFIFWKLYDDVSYSKKILIHLIP